MEPGRTLRMPPMRAVRGFWKSGPRRRTPLNAGGFGIAVPRKFNRQKKPETVRINRNIRAKEVRVIDPDASRTAAIDEVIERAKSLGHSRVPVYHEDVDHIIGVLYLKDLLKIDPELSPDVTLSEIVRPAHYTPESKNAGDLLRELQYRRIHIAIVVDEYGGTAGLVTLEDLIEEIVGDIRDEYDEDERPIRIVDKRTVIADGGVHLDELAEELGVELESEDVDTLGGYLMEAFGRIPSQGEKTERAGLEFTVEALDDQRVTRVRITRLESGESEEEKGE